MPPTTRILSVDASPDDADFVARRLSTRPLTPRRRELETRDVLGHSDLAEAAEVLASSTATARAHLGEMLTGP